MDESYIIKWPTPNIFDITIVLGLALLIVIIYGIYKYYETKERERIHNNNLFLMQVKRKGLNDDQLKLIKNMIFYLKLKNPMYIVSDANLFESNLTGFIEYIKSNNKDEDKLKDIFRDLIIINERLFGPKQLKIRMPLESMSEIETGGILYLIDEKGGIFLGKNIAKRESYLELQLFIPPSELKYFEDETNISINLIKPDDAEYLIHTFTMGIKSNLLLVKMSDDFTKVREFRQPYIDVMISAYITIYSQDGKKEPVNIECTIFKINKNECVLRINTALEYEKEYPISFEIDDFKYNVSSRIISLKTVDKKSVYYATFKFMDMTQSGRNILTKYISESE